MKYIKISIIFIINIFIFHGCEVAAHSLFNSAESIIGNYKVQIATLPEIPTTNEKSLILFKVNNFNSKNEFKMGLRIFYDDILIDYIKPVLHNGDYYEMGYIFTRSGNHIFKVDLYDNDKIDSTHTFNVSTHNPFGYIFFYSIAVGSIGLAIIICSIYIPKRIKR